MIDKPAECAKVDNPGVQTDQPRPAEAGTSSQPRRPAWSHVFNVVLFLVGASVLAWMLQQTGWGELYRMAQNVGRWGFLILGLDIVSTLLDAAAIRTFMRPESRMVSYWRVLAAQASGRAINVLTPLGALGEAAKVTVLVSHAPRSRVVSSIVLYNLCSFYLSVAAILIGTPITLLLVPLPHALKVVVGVGIAVIIVAMIALAIVIHRGAGATLVAIIHAAKLISNERSARWKTRIAEIDGHIRELQRLRSFGTHRGVYYVIASKMVVWTATIVLLLAADVDVSVGLVVGVLSVGVLIQWISSVVPLGMGLADGGNYALYTLLGSTGAEGFYVTMLNRARNLVAAVMGLAAMAIINVYDRGARGKARRRLAPGG
ncbi:MAG: lysylphosphatidylglycerol synthase transmembrane domain-containing protein [Kofleriaceae bacterium]